MVIRDLFILRIAFFVNGVCFLTHMADYTNISYG
jgi:hypothetical protein